MNGETQEDLTEDELEELLGGYPKPKDKAGVWTFFKRVLTTKDTTRSANLDIETELGLGKIPVRTLQNIALFCEEMGMKGLAHHFSAEAQIITNSSLSKDGFLIKTAVTQKRETELKTKSQARPRRRWFGREEKIPQQM